MKHGIQTVNLETNSNSQLQVNSKPEPQAQAQPRPLFVINSVEDLFRLPPEQLGAMLSPEARAELEKMREACETLEAPKRLAEAEAEVSATLPAWLEAIASKHKTSFAGRKLVVVFRSAPKEGESPLAVSFGPEVEVIPASSGGRKGGGHGFRSHGEVVHHPEAGKEIHFASLNAMAKAYGWKYEGRPTAQIAVEKPVSQADWEKMSSAERAAIPTRNRLETKTENGKTVIHVYPVA